MSLAPFEPIDFDALHSIAEGQSVVGLIAAGLEQVSDTSIGRMQARPFLVDSLIAEKGNKEMNKFINELFGLLADGGVSAVLIKGQGVAQCYQRPLWRSAGDVDLLLDADNYEKAKDLLLPRATKVDKEGVVSKHQGMMLDGFEVELHGTFRSVTKRMNTVLDDIQKGVNCRGDIRLWDNDGTDIPLPSADADAVFIFTHIVTHFYKGGIGLRQICDWCRLLWTCRDVIDRPLLQSRLVSAGLVNEWKVFGAFAVDNLGVPVDAMPFYEVTPSIQRKVARLQAFIIKAGNFGHNRDMSYYRKYPYVIRKAISASQRIGDGLSHMRIFPQNSARITVRSLVGGTRAAMRGE